VSAASELHEGRGAAAAPLMRASGLTKEFPGLRALDDVSIDVAAGEIVAIVGHNGSGKSTLVKILAGVYTADAGRVDFAEGEGEGEGEGAAIELHIIHQDLGLVAELSAIENFGLTESRAGRGLAPTRTRRDREHARALISRFGETFDVDIPVGQLTPAQRAIIAIARALDGWAHDRNVLVLDEPTEALHASEVEILFRAIRRVADAGAGVLFISHRLDEVLQLASRVVVLRDGRKVADVPKGDLDHDGLVRFVTGAARDSATRVRDRARGPVVLDVKGLTGAGVREVDVQIRAGEVVGVAGVLGSGRDVLPSLVFGAAPASADHYSIDGTDYPRRAPRASVQRGLAYVAGDRGRLGGIRAMTARENVTLPELQTLTGPMGWLRAGQERQVTQGLLEQYDVRPPRAEQQFAKFSGGNQQKIVFAKWLRLEPRVLLLEEPTQGVDIGAKQSIYSEIDRVAERGVAVLVCSSDAKELVRLCDRVLVMRDGEVVAELQGDRLTESALVLQEHGLIPSDVTSEEKASHDSD
jgi:ABC-type sugar transport system ATPase subunit